MTNTARLLGMKDFSPDMKQGTCQQIPVLPGIFLRTRRHRLTVYACANDVQLRVGAALFQRRGLCRTPASNS
eukprot:jgi/Psemu1/308256/fgenesh1_kg.392_\